MHLDFQIVSGPIASSLPASQPDGSVGSVIEFRGIVRAAEPDGITIDGLHYEAYPAMAERSMLALLHAAATRFNCSDIRCLHSTGWVPVGATSLWLSIATPHRREGIDALAWILDRLKADVPIWKSKERPSRQREGAL